MKTVFRTLLAIGVASEIVVLIFAAVSSSFSAWWAVVPLAFIVVAVVLLFAGMVVDRRREGSWPVSLPKTADRFGVPRKALALVVSEVTSLGSLTQIFRRPLVPAGGEVHTGYKNLRTVIFLILGLVIVEIAVVHLAVPSQFWRLLLLVLSVYALLLLLGFYTSVKTNPHILTPRGLQLRHGGRFVCEIPWESLSLAKKASPGQGGDVIIGADGEVRLPVLSEVNVRLEMKPPVPAEDLYQGRADVSSIEIYCDDRKAFLDSVEQARKMHTT